MSEALKEALAGLPEGHVIVCEDGGDPIDVGIHQLPGDAARAHPAGAGSSVCVIEPAGWIRRYASGTRVTLTEADRSQQTDLRGP